MLHGNGSPTRHYLYAADAVDAFDYVLAKGQIGQIYNVASEDEISNIELCRLLLAEGGHDVATREDVEALVEFVQDRPFNDDRYAVDGTKLRELGWTQRTQFSEGLTRTYAWYKEHGLSWWGNILPILTAYPISVVSDDGHSELLASP